MHAQQQILTFNWHMKNIKLVSVLPEKNTVKFLKYFRTISRDISWNISRQINSRNFTPLGVVRQKERFVIFEGESHGGMERDCIVQERVKRGRWTKEDATEKETDRQTDRDTSAKF